MGDPSEDGDGVLTRRFRFFLGFFLPFDAEGVVGVVGGTWLPISFGTRSKSHISFLLTGSDGVRGDLTFFLVKY